MHNKIKVVDVNVDVFGSTARRQSPPEALPNTGSALPGASCQPRSEEGKGVGGGLAVEAFA